MKNIKSSLIALIAVVFLIPLVCAGFLKAKYIFTQSDNTFVLDIDANFYITFDPNGGEIKKGESEYIVEYQGMIATLPTAEKVGYTLQGWNRSGLPHEYIEIEYLTSTGTQYIDSGIPISSKNDIEVTFSKNSGAGSSVRFVCSENPFAGNPNRGIFLNNGNILNIQNGKGSRSTETLANDTFYNLKICENYYEFDGVRKPNGDGTVDSPYSYILFGARQSGSNEIDSRLWVGSIKSAKIWQSGTLKRDMIPCIRVSDGMPGMYDFVSHSFYGSETGDRFEAGPVVDDFIRPDEAYTHTVPRDCLFSAVWTPDTHKITLDANDKTGSTRAEGLLSTVTNATYDLKYTEEQLPALKREGYDFLGWFDEDDNEYTVGEDIKLTSDITLYAKWEAKKYHIYFESEEEDIPESIEVEFDSICYNIPAASPSEGYVFDGWKNKTVSEEYELLEYITSTGTQYIDTDVLMEPDNDIEITFSSDDKVEKDAKFLFGVNGEADKSYRGAFIRDDNDIGINLGIQNSLNGRISIPTETDVFHTLRFSKDEVWLDEDKYKNENKYEGNDYTYSLFTAKTLGSGTIESTAKWWTGSVKSAKIWENAKPAHDLLPVRKIETDKVGMLNTITNEFLSNANPNGGNFIPGPTDKRWNAIIRDGDTYTYSFDMTVVPIFLPAEELPEGYDVMNMLRLNINDGSGKTIIVKETR